jgi:hypothetical protein
MTAWRLVSAAVLAGALLIPADVPAADKPHIEPIERTPYSRDDDAPPTPLGFIIGSCALVVLVGSVGLAMRRRTREDDRRRRLKAHPRAHPEDATDPWLAREAVEHAKALVPELDDEWAGRNGGTVRVDPYTRVRVTPLTELDDAPPGKDRLVVHVHGAVRDPRVPVGWTPVRRLLRPFRSPGRRRGFAEFWTLEHADGAWSLLRIEPDRTARPSRATRAKAPWAQG